jgi:hypothetical protein
MRESILVRISIKSIFSSSLPLSTIKVAAPNSLLFAENPMAYASPRLNLSMNLSMISLSILFKIAS